MAAANAIAILIAQNTTSTNTQFTAKNGATTIGSTSVNGSWSRSGNTITWTGNAPSVTAGSATTANGITVAYPAPLSFAGILGQGTYTGISLTDGDTLVFSGIDISFTTTDLV